MLDVQGLNPDKEAKNFPSLSWMVIPHRYTSDRNSSRISPTECLAGSWNNLSNFNLFLNISYSWQNQYLDRNGKRSILNLVCIYIYNTKTPYKSIPGKFFTDPGPKSESQMMALKMKQTIVFAKKLHRLLDKSKLHSLKILISNRVIRCIWAYRCNHRTCGRLQKRGLKAIPVGNSANRKQRTMACPE